MKKILILFWLIISAVFVMAQKTGGNSIAGTVLNAETKAPLEYATVTIFIAGEKKPMTGTTTDKTGSFTLPDIPTGTFTIVIENIGFAPFTKNELVINKKDAIINLKNISLTVEKTTLQDVTVVGKSRLVENRIDKMIFNAEKDVSSQGGVATDVLKKVPQVSVDADGNVQLAGSSGIRFLINGKPSSAFGSNIADVLQSIPASQIKTIEVITNPGAKYDAQGMGGIINIILKNNNTKGYNGNISVSAGTRNENASVNLNMRKNTFGMNAFFSGNKRLRSAASSNNHRVTTDSNLVSILDQNSNSHFDRQGYQTGMGFDWTYKKFNSFSGNLAFNFFGFNGQGSTEQDLQPNKTGGLPSILSLINSNNQYRYRGVNGSLNYKRTFKKEDQELEASISLDKGKNDGRNNSEQFLFPQDSLFYGIRAVNPGITHETVVAVDYTQPIASDVKLGIGSKGTFYTIDNSAAVNSYQPATGNYIPSSFLSNSLSYRQHVYAGYAELTFPVAKLFDVKIGSRYERTEVNAYYSQAGKVDVPGYNTIVPSIFLSKKIGESQVIKLNFSKRINRPDYEDLNPFVNTADPKNLSTGNPYLKPEIGYRYEVGYSRDLGKAGSLSANLFYRINEDDIQPYVVYYPSYTVGDSLYTNVSVNTRSNIGREDNAGLNVFADVKVNSKLSLRSNISLFHRHIINAINPGFNSSSFNYRINMNASYQFTNTLVTEFFGNFNSPRNEAQGKYPSFTSYTHLLSVNNFGKRRGALL